MTRLALTALPLALSLSVLTLGCGDDKTGSDDTGTDPSGGDDDDDDDDDDDSASGCPDDVPEEYQYLWDCDNTSCDGTLAYHYGSGTSDADGNFNAEETWFLFSGGGEYCTDTFEIEGEVSAYDPTTFNCSECEEIYWVEMLLSSGNNCGLAWGSLFVDNGDNVEGPFEGAWMFDTHNAFGDRNEDNKMLVITGLVENSYIYPSPDWGRGTAEPTSSTDGPPQDYLWANSGMCLSSGRRSVSNPESGVRLPELQPEHGAR